MLPLLGSQHFAVRAWWGAVRDRRCSLLVVVTRARRQDLGEKQDAKEGYYWSSSRCDSRMPKSWTSVFGTAWGVGDRQSGPEKDVKESVGSP